MGPHARSVFWFQMYATPVPRHPSRRTLPTIHGSSATGVSAMNGVSTAMIAAAIPMFRNENTSALIPEFETNLRM